MGISYYESLAVTRANRTKEVYEQFTGMILLKTINYGVLSALLLTCENMLFVRAGIAFAICTAVSFSTSMLLFGALAALIGPANRVDGRILWRFKEGYTITTPIRDRLRTLSKKFTRDNLASILSRNS
jgi:hypothetical protein